MPFVTIEDAERQLVTYANTQPALLNLLWELDYMPEQVTKRDDRVMMLRIISVFALGASVEREVCANIAGDHRCRHPEEIACQHEIATSIRARGKG